MTNPARKRKKIRDMRFQQWLTFLGIVMACLAVLFLIEAGS